MIFIYRMYFKYVRYRRPDVFSCFGFVRFEPPPDRTGILPELSHELAQFGGGIVRPRTEHVDVVETGIKKVICVDGQSVPHDEGSGDMVLQKGHYWSQFLRKSCSGIGDVEVVAICTVRCKTDLVDVIDHGVHDGEKDLLNLLALLELFRVVRDEEPCSSNSSNYCDGFSHLVVEIHPVLRSIVLSFEPFWAVVHVVGKFSITGDLLVCFSNLHP